MNTAPSLASPFKGLAPFDDSDADALLFFGRARDTATIVANLQAARVTILFGPSGVGKSSVLRAGVAHALRREPDVTVVLADAWAGDAHAALAETAQTDDAELYLILDQFEEYFTYHTDDESLAAPLAELLARSNPRANILISIREDMLGQLDAFKRELPGLLDNRLRLERLDRPAATEAIRGPIEEYNRRVPADESVSVEPELVELLLDDVRVGHVQLGGTGRGGVGNGASADRVEAPFLQLVLERLWDEERTSGSRTLRLTTFRRLGGASQIVRAHLEGAMAGLRSDEQNAAAAMYDHLVTPSGTKIAHGVRDLARYARVSEPEAALVLGKLARERILRGTADDGGVGVRYEIFHDVLADAVLAWRARHEEAEALARAHEQRRRARIFAAVALGGLLIVAAIAIFALLERSNARSQADRAQAREFVAEALNLFGTDPTASVRLAYDAARIERGPHEEDVLRNALARDRLRTTMHTGGRVTTVAFDSSAARVLVASTDGKVRLYRRGSSRPLRVFDHRAPVEAAALRGHLVLSGGADGRVRVWDVATGKRVRTLDARGPVRTLAFGVNGSELLTGAVNGTVRLWSARTWRPLHSLRTHVKKRLVNAVLDPAGKRVLAVTDDRFLRVYSVRTGKQIRSIEHDGFVRSVVFSPNGRLLLTSDHGGTVRLWRAIDLRPVRQLHGALGNVPVAVWSHDGTKIAAGSSDGTARMWDVATGNQIAIMIGHTNEVTSVAFNPAGDAVVSTSSDNTARVWGASPDKGGRLISVLAGHTGAVTSAVFSSDGRSVLTGSDDGTARLWDPGSEPDLVVKYETADPITAFAVNDAGDRIVIGHRHEVRILALPRGRPVHGFDIRGPVRDVAFGPQGPLAVVSPGTAIAYSARRDLVARAESDTILIGPDHRPPTRTLRLEGSPIYDLAFSPDGRTLAAALDDGTAQLWDVDSGRLTRTLRAHTDRVYGVAYSHDGKLLVTASRDHDAKIWNPATGALVTLLHGHFGPVLAAAFSPDDRWVVTAGPTTVGLWKAATGEQAFLRGPTKAPIVGVAFGGPDGRTVVSAGGDGTVRTFHCDLCGNVQELLEIAKRRLSRG